MAGNDHLGLKVGDQGMRSQRQSHGVDPRSIWQGLLRHSLMIALITAAVTLAALYYVMNTTPLYRASASLLIETQNSNVVSIDELYGYDTQDSQYYQTQIEILRSRNLAQRVVDSLNLWNHPELTGDTPASDQQDTLAYRAIDSTVAAGSNVLSRMWNRAKSIVTGEEITASGATTAAAAQASGALDVNTAPQVVGAATAMAERNAKRARTVEQLMGRINIVPVRNTKFVTIEYVSADPLLASRVANAVGLQYIASFLDSKATATDRASSWLEEQLKTLKAQLVDSEERLLEYKRANGLVDFNGNVGRLNEQELLLVSRDLAAAKNRLDEARDVYAKAQSLSGFPGALDTLSEFQNDPIIRRLSVDIGLANQQLQELSNRYGERHPLRVDAKSKLDTLEELRKDNVSRVLGSLEQNVSLATARVRALERDLSSARTGIEDIATKGIELEALESEVETNQKLYNTFFVRITETRSADGLEKANASVSDYAVPPPSPFKPRKALVVGSAALTALILSMLLSLLLERLNKTIRGVWDVESGLGVKLLGITPVVKSGLFSRSSRLPISPLGSGGKNAEFLEAIDSIRAELHSTGLLDKSKVILITSSEPNEGKTTVAINLAHSLAQQERVLLVDCDLRRPSVATAMGIDPRLPGLTHVLEDLNNISKVLVRQVGNSNLDVIPAGTMPDHPLRTLMSNNLACVLMVARRHYDRIIIDTPPIHAVSDALVISKLVDSCVYVGASHSTGVAQARRGLERLYDAGANVAGFIVSRVDIKKLARFGGDQQFQGYFDKYGYSAKPVEGTLGLDQDIVAPASALVEPAQSGNLRQAQG